MCHENQYKGIFKKGGGLIEYAEWSGQMRYKNIVQWS